MKVSAWPDAVRFEFKPKKGKRVQFNTGPINISPRFPLR